MTNLHSKSLHYHKLGSGPRILLAFHGIGQDGLGCFQPVEDTLGKYYTIFAFDLFFHGESADAEVSVISKELWKALINDFLTENKITNFDIAGFSMGGRFALATLEALPKHIENVFLIAPDGISENPLYTIATRNSFGRTLFRQVMQNPGLFFRIIQLLKKTNIVNSSLVRFTGQVLNTTQKRERIFRSWTAFRDLRFDIPQIAQLTKTNHIRIFLFTGQFDKILNRLTVNRLGKLLPTNQNVHLKSGHSQLVAQSGAWICSLFE
jgi:pimeloyl-ACP methyl ester carboxylesterase